MNLRMNLNMNLNMNLSTNLSTIISRTTKPALAIIIATGASSMTACSSSSKHAGNIGSIRSNPTPAMHTLAKRASDRANTHAVVVDTDIRALHNDIDTLFHMNRPSRLHGNIKPN